LALYRRIVVDCRFPQALGSDKKLEPPAHACKASESKRRRPRYDVEPDHFPVDADKPSSASATNNEFKILTA
jgi:hypothetical protein